MKPYQTFAPAAFCRTPAAAGIHRIIDLVRTMPGIGMGAIVGAPGVGKTTALLRYADEQRGVRYCAMNPAQSSMPRMLARVCEALDGPTGIVGAAALHEHIRALIRDRVPQALLIDEAQRLDDRSLDELRCIHDETALPMVFAGNDRLRDRVTGTRAAAFGQFASRIGPRMDIESASEGDVRAIAVHHGIVDEVAVSWLARQCVGVSGLRNVSRLMKLAERAAEGRAVQLSHLKKVAGALGEAIAQSQEGE